MSGTYNQLSPSYGNMPDVVVPPDHTVQPPDPRLYATPVWAGEDRSHGVSLVAPVDTDPLSPANRFGRATHGTYTLAPADRWAPGSVVAAMRASSGEHSLATDTKDSEQPGLRERLRDRARRIGRGVLALAGAGMMLVTGAGAYEQASSDMSPTVKLPDTAGPVRLDYTQDPTPGEISTRLALIDAAPTNPAEARSDGPGLVDTPPPPLEQ